MPIFVNFEALILSFSPSHFFQLLQTDIFETSPHDVALLEKRSAAMLVSDVVEKTSTRRRSRIPCVVVEKLTTRRREGVGVVVEKNEESRRTFNKNYYDLLTAIAELLIVHSRSSLSLDT